ncbi:MAG: DEAD/DEAH box helicase [Elusimicrobiota bacterium]|nr:DEAD/DEAH box helicase [Endomicrobiia bacterium]MCX7942462.1 DEAD/DEAH box helicase [Dictyoglomaceae bacterium]MDW8166343.1 DEAD/DEAH box helicase [Elusimicrobiota bacterium]
MKSDKLEEIKHIKSKLYYTWNTFFARFGNLTDVQIETIPRILNKKNLIIISSTASGKTEAVIAPSIERFKKEKWNGLSILYIVPTRALANDIYLRLEGQLRDLGINCEYKHGDKPNINYKNLPELLITTSESLDSLLCRHSDIFDNLKILIVDEIHFFDNTYRGDQLRVLIKRLRNLIKNDFNTYLLSATVADPKDVGKRYMEDFETVRVDVRKNIEYQIIKDLKEIKNIVREKGLKKLLSFCNYRESTERLKFELEPLLKFFNFVVHHGNLDRKLRREAEKVLRESRYSVCISTSTLEVGIDIGTIDCVFLYEIPWSLFSLTQRIGRGNRKSMNIFSLGYVENDEEEIILRNMYEMVKRGEYIKEEYKSDYSVIVQQIFSILYQFPEGVIYEDLYSLVKDLCDEEIFTEILDYILEEEYIHHKGNKYYLSTEIRDLGDRGKIHSNIPDNFEYKVIDVSSGKEIGKLSGFFDEVFILAGNCWKVYRIDEERKIILVKKIKASGTIPSFERKRTFGAYLKYLPENVKELMIKC